MRAFGARWKPTIRDRGEKSLREEKESVRKVLQGRGVYTCGRASACEVLYAEQLYITFITLGSENRQHKYCCDITTLTVGLRKAKVI